MKSRLFILVIVGLCLGFVCSPATSETSAEKNKSMTSTKEAAFPDSLKPLLWVVGSWTRESESSTLTETWTQVSDTTFEGRTFSVKKESGKTVFSESLRIVFMEGDIFYLAKVSHNPLPIPFKLISWSDTTMIFENKNHDFPNCISYLLKDAGKLSVTVSGKDEKTGEDKAFTLEFSRDKDKKNQ